MKVVIRNGPQKSLCELGKLIAQGGAGAIYLVKGHPEWVAKIYMHPNSTQINHQAATHERERIEAMLGRPPQIKAPHLGQYHQLAWPLGIIENPAGQVLGFTMSKLPLDKACDLESLITKSGRAAERLPEDYIVRLFASHNIAALVRELHREKHYIVDMKPKNMSIYKTNEAKGLVAILDSDGFSINSTNGKRFPANMFSSEYIAPELLKNNSKPDQAGENQDRWALAVIIFRLLNNSTHPYSGVYHGLDSHALDDHVKSDRYAYGRKAHPDISPRPGSIHEYLDDETRNLFDRSFGKDYYQRPSAKEWRDHLQTLTDLNNKRILQCKRDVTHWHFSKGCPFCQRAQIIRQQKSVQITVPAKTSAPSARAPFPTTIGSPPPPTWPWGGTKRPPTFPRQGASFKLIHLLAALGFATGVYVVLNRTADKEPVRASQPAAAPVKPAQEEMRVPESRLSIKHAQLNNALTAEKLETARNILGALTPDEKAGLDLEQLNKRIDDLEVKYDTLKKNFQDQSRTGRWVEAERSFERLARMSPSDVSLPLLKTEMEKKMANSQKSRVDSSDIPKELEDLESTREP